MQKKAHEKNSRWWQAKSGEATAEEVATFAREYQRGEDAGAWCVAVAEGGCWIAAHPIRDVVSLTGDRLHAVVWVSDGQRSQCVWRFP